MAKKILLQLDELPKTRAEALVTGGKWFFTGEPCKYGHTDARYASTGACVTCNRINVLRWKKANLAKVQAWDRALKARQYAEDPERFIKRVLEFYNKHRNAKKLYMRLWRLDNLERQRGKDRQARRDNPDLFRARDKARHLAQPEKKLAHNRNRKARMKGALGRHTAADIRRIRAEQNDQCAYCEADLGGKGHVDHVIPLALGGTNWPENIVLACVSCNTRKHTSSVKVFLRRLKEQRKQPAFL